MLNSELHTNYAHPNPNSADPEHCGPRCFSALLRIRERGNNAVDLHIVLGTVVALFKLEESESKLDIAADGHDYRPVTVTIWRIPVWE